MKFSKKDAKALTILLLQWLGEEKDRYLFEWENIYNYHLFAFPICLHIRCDECPIRGCSSHIKSMISYDLPLKERKKRAALMARKVRSLKW